MSGEKVLVVEDEKNIVKLLKFNLEGQGYRVVAAADGEAGLDLLRRERPDLVILDVMLPKLDGFEFCREARRETRTPILMLTAKKEEVDKLLGLELGADDYVTKPFSVREVLSRVKAILRRSGPRAAQKEQAASAIRVGALELDFERYEIRVKGKAVAMSAKEFDFLGLLARADGKVVTREQAIEKLWDTDDASDLDTRAVDQHVKRLRGKLGPEGDRIVTVKGVGYRLKLD